MRRAVKGQAEGKSFAGPGAVNADVAEHEAVEPEQRLAVGEADEEEFAAGGEGVDGAAGEIGVDGAAVAGDPLHRAAAQGREQVVRVPVDLRAFDG